MPRHCQSTFFWTKESNLRLFKLLLPATACLVRKLEEVEFFVFFMLESQIRSELFAIVKRMLVICGGIEIKKNVDKKE